MSQPAALTQRPRPDLRAGIIETLLVFEGGPVELDPHLARLRTSAGTLYGQEPPPLRELIRGRAREAGLGRMRVTLAPRDGGLDPEIAIAEFPPQLVLPLEESSSELRALPVDRGYGEHKWADRALLGEAETAAGNGFVPLLVDLEETVLEASRANVFLVREGKLVTPPLDGRILPGIVRSAVFELAAGFGAEVEERTFGVEEVDAAEEVFLTGSLRGVEPVGGIDGRPLNAVGPLTRELAAGLRERWFGAWL
ncbi:MAG: aminotransferase class IV [Solirubrobacterales bacterium]